MTGLVENKRLMSTSSKISYITTYMPWTIIRFERDLFINNPRIDERQRETIIDTVK